MRRKRRNAGEVNLVVAADCSEGVAPARNSLAVRMDKWQGCSSAACYLLLSIAR